MTTAVCGVFVDADTFEEIALWALEKEAWLRQYVSLPNRISSHDTFARLFGLIDPQQFEAAFRRWVAEVLPELAPNASVLARTIRQHWCVENQVHRLDVTFAD